MKLLLALTILLTGCGSLRQQGHAAVAADGVTTVVGVGSGIAAEANPLIASPGALVASVVARAGIIEYINTLDEPSRTANLSSFNSVTWGFVANNLAVLAGVSLAPVLGVAAGWYYWHSTQGEREFAAICADEKTRNLNLVCTFNRS